MPPLLPLPRDAHRTFRTPPEPPAGPAPRCACIEDSAVIRKIQHHLQEKLPLDSAVRIPHPRAPPQASLFGTQKVLNGVSMAVGMMEKALYSSYTTSGFHRLRDADVLTIGRHDWQVVVGSGHSPEHACLYCAALGVMISGDQILPVISCNVSVHPTEPDANPLMDWMESHNRFLRIPDDTFVLPAHNLPFYGIRERLRELISHHEDRMLAIEEHCVEPDTAKALLPVLFARELDPRQMMMALGEAIAHVHLLMYRNRIRQSLHEDGRYRFLSIDPDLARRSHPDTHDAPDDGPIMV